MQIMFRHHYSSGICTNIYDLSTEWGRNDCKLAIERVKTGQIPGLRHWQFDKIETIDKDIVLAEIHKIKTTCTCGPRWSCPVHKDRS